MGFKRLSDDWTFTSETAKNKHTQTKKVTMLMSLNSHQRERMGNRFQHKLFCQKFFSLNGYHSLCHRELMQTLSMKFALTVMHECGTKIAWISWSIHLFTYEIWIDHCWQKVAIFMIFLYKWTQHVLHFFLLLPQITCGSPLFIKYKGQSINISNKDHNTQRDVTCLNI